MKRLLTASAALLIIAASPTAFASDLGFAPASYDWEGIYFGANLGAGVTNNSLSSNYAYRGTGTITPPTAALIDDMSSSYNANDGGFTGGISTGYNWQYSNVVVGLEADINYLDATSSDPRNVSNIVNSIFTANATSAVDSLRYETEWFGTIRGRLGYAFDNILLYGTGGFAYGYANASSSFQSYNDLEYADWSGSDEGWRFGWTVGGGMEYGVDRWIVGLEYLYVDLGSYDWSSTADINLLNNATEAIWKDVGGSGSMDYAFSLIRGTVKYRF